MIVSGMALVTYALRVAPQLLLSGWGFPPAWDRYLRYLAYGLVASIVSATLFISSGSFAAAAAPRRLIALGVAVAVAAWTRSAVAGMFAGTGVALLFSRLAA
jgi:branched-subunit amino acid transport protein